MVKISDTPIIVGQSKLRSWRETRKKVDAKRAFIQLVENGHSIPDDLAKEIASTLQVPLDKPSNGLQQALDVQNYALQTIDRGEEVDLQELFKLVSQNHGVEKDTVEKNYYRKKVLY